MKKSVCTCMFVAATLVCATVFFSCSTGDPAEIPVGSNPIEIPEEEKPSEIPEEEKPSEIPEEEKPSEIPEEEKPSEIPEDQTLIPEEYDPSEVFAGETTYSGTFTTTTTVYSPADGTRKIETRTVTLKLKENTFICLDHSENNSLSADGAGRYQIKGDKIRFQDHCVRDAMNSWTWILTGTYDYTLDKGRLKLVRIPYDHPNSPVYEYDLIKQ